MLLPCPSLSALRPLLSSPLCCLPPVQFPDIITSGLARAGLWEPATPLVLDQQVSLLVGTGGEDLMPCLHSRQLLLLCVHRPLQAMPVAARAAHPWSPLPLPCGSLGPSGGRDHGALGSGRVLRGASGRGSRGAGQSPPARGSFGPLARGSPDNRASGGATAAAAAAAGRRGKGAQRASSSDVASPLYRRRSLSLLPPAAPLATGAEAPLTADQQQEVPADAPTGPQAEGRVSPRWLSEERVARPLLLLGLRRLAKRRRPGGEGGGLGGRGVPVSCLEDSDAEEGLSESLSGCARRRQGADAAETLSGLKKEEDTGTDGEDKLLKVSAMHLSSSLAATKTDGDDDLPPTSALSPSSLVAAEAGLHPHHPKRLLLETPLLTEEQGAPKRPHHDPGGGTPAPAPLAGPTPSFSPIFATAAAASSAPTSPTAGSAARGSNEPLAAPMAVTVAAGLGGMAASAPDGDAEAAPAPAPMQAIRTGLSPSAAQGGRAKGDDAALVVPPSAAQVERATEGGNTSNVAVAACCARVRAEAEAKFERVLACQVQQQAVLPCRRHLVNPQLCRHLSEALGLCWELHDPVIIRSLRRILF